MKNSPAVPKVGFFTRPSTYHDITGAEVKAEEMDLCVRVLSIFKCHKACPLTSASAIAVAAQLKGSIITKSLPAGDTDNFAFQNKSVRIGHPGGVMTMYPDLITAGEKEEQISLPGVAVSRTARRIMDGMVYIRN